MTNQDNKTVKSPAGRFNLRDWLFKVDPTRAIQSLKAFSKIIFVFTLAFLVAYFFKLFSIDVTTKHFRLILTKTDILPLYKISFINFEFLAAYEAIKLIVIALTFFYFIKFLNSMDMADPFKNSNSKNPITFVAALSILFFSIDAISAMHLSYFRDVLTDGDSISIFHFEYLFLAYFINVFAIIFKRGVDLKNEIDLVI